MRRISLVTSTLLLASFGLLSISDSADVAQATTQLPRTVRPTHYDVAIVPDIKALTFDGKVSIAIDVLEATNSITLNALDMNFSSVALLDGKGAKSNGEPKIQVSEKDQTATFTFAKQIAKGSYNLGLEYKGKIGTQASGLFAIDYHTKDGDKRALYTQFENSDARRMIPSWDEPAYKATFTLETTVPSNLMAVSNMPISQKTDAGAGRSRIRFGQSPKMSSYLLFYGLGEFERVTAKVGETEVGVVVQKGVASQAAFALESSQKVLREYNDYFGMPYPLPKLDNVASPGSSQFFSAMENWGAIYTFEDSILLDPTISTQADKQGAFTVAAHEIAHQWFGDLVTMSWWDDLWLNEGFASWMEGRTTEKLHPEWNTALSAVNDREAAISRDSLATTHPVVQHIATVEQASQAFDSITYQKGEAVIRMLEGYVGADAWRDGVRLYMKKHAYANTVSDDLWREIEAAAKKPILDIAHDFTLQPGVPLISVEDAACSGGNTTLQLSQGEFSKDQPNKKSLSWRVPVIAKPVGNGTPVRTIVTGGKATMTIPGCNPIVVNAGQSGYYRTRYAPKQFAQIKNSYASLAAIDQLGIFSDTLSMGLAGLEPTSNALDLVVAMPADADPMIWRTVAGALYSINDYYGKGAQGDKFRAFASAHLTPVFAKIGWTAKPGEADTIAILRNQLISVLSALGNKEVIAEAQRRYAASKSDPATLPAAIRKTVLGVIARHADAATWDQLHAQAVNEKTPMIRDQIYSLLASTEDEALARRALDLALTAEPGATNSAGMISRVADLHPDLAFDFAIANLSKVDEKLDGSARRRFYPRLASGSRNASMIQKVDAYAIAHVPPESRRDAETAKASITYRIKVRTERLPSIDQWLSKKG
jgi:aminopeptidase N